MKLLDLEKKWSKEELKQIREETQAQFGWDDPEEGQSRYIEPPPLLKEFGEWSGIGAESPLITAAISSQEKYGGKAGMIDPTTNRLILAPEFAAGSGYGWQDLEGTPHFTESPSKSFFEQMGGWDTIKGLGLVGGVVAGGALLAPEIAAGGVAAGGALSAADLAALEAAGGMSFPITAAEGAVGVGAVGAGGVAAGTAGLTAAELAAAGVAGKAAGAETAAGLTEGTSILGPAGAKIVDAAGNVVTKTATDTASNALPWLIGGTTLANYLAQTDAAKKAAEAQTSSVASSNALLNEIDLRNRAALAPYTEASKELMPQYLAKIKSGPGEFTESPGYTFRVGEGIKALDRSAAAKGNLFSGRTGKELTRFGQDYATSDYDNWLRRYYDSLTPYQSGLGLGLTATGANVNSSTGVGGQQAQNLLRAGEASASLPINQANALTSATSSGLNNYLMWKYLSEGKGM